MASFRTHISFGIAFGVMSVFLMMSFAIVPPAWSFFVLVWLMAVIGAILPDMDSDSGVPFHMTFGSLSLVVGGLVFLGARDRLSGEYLNIVLLVALSMGIVWGVFGSAFKRFTRHRGMAHSIPAALLSGLLVFWFAARFGFDEWRAFLLGIAITIGYILHLLLDEVYATVNFHGIPFVPNKSLGSALKLFSKSRSINTLVYSALIFSLLGNGAQLFRLGDRLLSVISK